MRNIILLFTLLPSLFLSSIAYPLGLELEVGASVGTEKQEFETKPEGWDELGSTVQKFTEKVLNPFTFGFRMDGRLLVLHSPKMHLGVGAGFGYDRASTSATLKIEKMNLERTVDRSYLRISCEPNIKFVYFVTQKIGLGLGAGYYLGLSGDEETKSSGGMKIEIPDGSTPENKQETVKVKLKSDNGLRIRAAASYVLSSKNQSQIQAGYQLTTAGKFEAEASEPDDKSEKLKQSGHAFVLSYIHPIIFGGAPQTDESAAQNKGKQKPGENKNQRRKKQQPQN
ncbi:MAG: hypothetical protein FJY29_12590 [Betaproteobacteria bacterium]|nr:hypothetical protein [Betaproteobacteria bacterium]